MQEQLGHASIELTVGTYGRWLRKKAPTSSSASDPLTGQGAATACASSVSVLAVGTGPNGSLALSEKARKWGQ